MRLYHLKTNQWKVILEKFFLQNMCTQLSMYIDMQLIFPLTNIRATQGSSPVFPETLFIRNKSHLNFFPHMHTQKNALDNIAVSVCSLVCFPSPTSAVWYLITGWSGPQATYVSSSHSQKISAGTDMLECNCFKL